jgi:hypothetical protein
MDRPMKSLQISKLLGDGQITELRIHICRFDDEKRQCFGLGVCTFYRSSPQSTHRFAICSTHKDHSQNAVLSSLTVTLLFTSGALLSPSRIHALQASDA